MIPSISITVYTRKLHGLLEERRLNILLEKAYTNRSPRLLAPSPAHSIPRGIAVTKD